MRLVCGLGAVVVAAAVAAGGCSDTLSIAELTTQDLAGTWVATSFTYTSGAQQVDLVANGGSLTQVISSAGTFTGTTVYPPFDLNMTFTGTFTLVAGVLTQDFDGTDAPTIVWQLTAYSDNSMTWEGAQGPWDFTDDGTFNPVTTASMKAVVTRQ